VPYLSALEVSSQRGAIQIHVYVYLYLTQHLTDLASFNFKHTIPTFLLLQQDLPVGNFSSRLQTTGWLHILD